MAETNERTVWWVRLVRVTGRVYVTLSQVVKRVGLVGVWHSKQIGQHLACQCAVPPLEHELNELTVLVNKQGGVEDPDPLTDISVPVAD